MLLFMELFIISLKSMGRQLISLLYKLYFIISDTLARQAAMIFKCILLMYYKNSRGRNYRKQVR